MVDFIIYMMSGGEGEHYIRGVAYFQHNFLICC